MNPVQGNQSTSHTQAPPSHAETMGAGASLGNHKVSIVGLDKARVLMALYNNGFWAPRALERMTIERAQQYTSQTLDFDYVDGRVIKTNINAKADLNAARTNGATTLLLFIDAQNRHTECLQALIDAKADLNDARTRDGATPLSIAARNGTEISSACKP